MQRLVPCFFFDEALTEMRQMGDRSTKGDATQAEELTGKLAQTRRRLHGGGMSSTVFRLSMVRHSC